MKMHQLSIFIFIFCTHLSQVSLFKSTPPSNFYGSPEVYSGYLSNGETYKDAFTLHDDHVTLSGTIPEVENALATVNTTGMYKYMYMYLPPYAFIIKATKTPAKHHHFLKLNYQLPPL